MVVSLVLFCFLLLFSGVSNTLMYWKIAVLADLIQLDSHCIHRIYLNHRSAIFQLLSHRPFFSLPPSFDIQSRVTMLLLLPLVNIHDSEVTISS